MSQMSNQMVKSFQASATIPAYVVVKGDTVGKVKVWDTTAAFVIGVSADYSNTDQVAPIVIGGTAKVRCAASVAAYTTVGPSTVTTNVTPGSIITTVFGTTTANLIILGIALENGSTNSVIEVLLQPLNWTGV